MARYLIELTDDTVVEADDARYACEGKFIEYIPRGAKTYEGEPETCVINSSAVRIIYRKPIGFKGGWRFNGEKDSLFARTEGSV